MAKKGPFSAVLSGHVKLPDGTMACDRILHLCEQVTPDVVVKSRGLWHEGRAKIHLRSVSEGLVGEEFRHYHLYKYGLEGYAYPDPEASIHWQLANVVDDLEKLLKQALEVAFPISIESARRQLYIAFAGKLVRTCAFKSEELWFARYQNRRAKRGKR